MVAIAYGFVHVDGAQAGFPIDKLGAPCSESSWTVALLLTLLVLSLTMNGLLWLKLWNKDSREVGCQSQCTYARHHAQPRFVMLPDYDAAVEKSRTATRAREPVPTTLRFGFEQGQI